MGLSETKRNGGTQGVAVECPPAVPVAREGARDGGAGVSWRGRKRLLEVELEVHGRSAVLRLHGSAGITEVAALRVVLDSLLRQGASAIVLDLSDLHYVAAAAASAIAAGICGRRPGGERIRLAAPSPSVLDVLIRSRVGGCVAIYPSVAAAMETTSSPEDPGRVGAGRGDGIRHGRKGRKLPIRIPVAYEAVEPILAVPVRKHPGSAWRRLAAGILWRFLADDALPKPA
jgi:anti-anti-sigma factor